MFPDPSRSSQLPWKYALHSTSLLFPFIHNPGSDNLDFVDWFVIATRLHKTHALNHPHSALDSAKDCVFSIQPRCWRKGDEELATVGVRPTVCHTQDPSSRMLQPSVNLVLEFLAVNRASSSAGAGRIASLDHKVGYNAVEDDVVVVASLRERGKIVTSLRTVNH